MPQHRMMDPDYYGMEANRDPLCLLEKKKILIAPHPLHRGASASLGMLEKAGLLTSFRLQAPSHPYRGSGFMLAAIMELTAARQSGTLTPFPLLIA